MQVYRVTEPANAGNVPQYVGTLAEAQKIIRGFAAVFRASFQVDRLEVVVDKSGVLALLNGNAVMANTEVVCTWRGTARGGLQPVEKEWSGSPCPKDPSNFWIDDDTGERVNAITGERTPPDDDDESETPEDSPSIESGVDNCDDAGTGEGRYHGRM